MAERSQSSSPQSRRGPAVSRRRPSLTRDVIPSARGDLCRLLDPLSSEQSILFTLRAARSIEVSNQQRINNSNRLKFEFNVLLRRNRLQRSREREEG